MKCRKDIVDDTLAKYCFLIIRASVLIVEEKEKKNAYDTKQNIYKYK